MQDQPVDPAALAGAAIAAALTSLGEKGPFNLMNLITGITIISLLVAYEWDRRRSVPQSVASGAILALIGLMIVGPILEPLDHWRRFGSFELAGTVDNFEGGRPSRKGEAEHYVEPQRMSAIDDKELILAWLILAGVVAGADIKYQQRRPRTRKTTGAA